MRIGPILEVTILSQNLAKSSQMYADAFQWQIEDSKIQVTLTEALRWEAAELVDRPTSRVIGINGSVRFIESADYQIPSPLKTHGWSSLEVCVNDVFTYTERAVAAGFELLNEPVPLSGNDKPLPLIASQLGGINGEVLYITQILSEVPNFELPDVTKESGSIFICVLGAANLELSRAALESNFEVRRASDRQVAIKVLNRIYGKDLTELHRLSSLQLTGRNAIEIDQLPIAAIAREKKTGLLPPGISIVSVLADVDAPSIFQLPDNALLELLPRN